MRADLALIGFGHVGRRFARLLEQQRQPLLDRFDLECRIVAISTRNHGYALSMATAIDGVMAAELVESGASLSQLRGTPARRPAGASGSQSDLLRNPRPVAKSDAPDLTTFATCLERLVSSDAPLKVVVETTPLDIHDGRPAIDHVERALMAGCHVVTSNKGPVAFAHRRLAEMAERASVSYLFEGAVMDGIPVFNLVRETLPSVSILGFRGVINATTNHILSALEDGDEFAPALARMQAEGIAEADASLDVDGWDAAAKAAALANVLLDAEITPHDVDRTGLGPASAAQARAARSRGHRLRLVASARRGENPKVRPVELPADDLLAGLRGTANAIVLETDLLGRVAVTQLDGSLTQTAYALLSDLVAIRRSRRAPAEVPLRRSP